MVHLSRVDLENLHPRILIGKRELDLSIQSTRSHQGGVQDIGSVGCADDLDIVVGGEAILLGLYPSRWFRS